MLTAEIVPVSTTASVVATGEGWGEGNALAGAETTGLGTFGKIAAAARPADLPPHPANNRLPQAASTPKPRKALRKRAGQEIKS